jgi:hypothetical protein
VVVVDSIPDLHAAVGDAGLEDAIALQGGDERDDVAMPGLRR